MIDCMLSTAAFFCVNFDSRRVELRFRNHFALRQIARALEIALRQFRIGFAPSATALLPPTHPASTTTSPFFTSAAD